MAIIVSASSATVVADDLGTVRHPFDPETRLLDALREVTSGNIDGATRVLESLIDQQPDFRLAHLLLGDLRSQRLSSSGRKSSARTSGS